MDEIQKLILDKLDNLDMKHDKLDVKLDHVLSEKIPGILVDVAKINERTSSQAKFYATIGGVLAVVLSIGGSVAVMMFK